MNIVTKITPVIPSETSNSFSGLLLIGLLFFACGKDDEKPANDAPIIIAQTFSVQEDAMPGSEVVTVDAEDAQNDELTFAIVSGNTGDAFEINASTASISVAEALDYETTANYVLVVSASDGTLSGTAQITINVTDVNEAPIINAQIFSIEENAAAGTTVGTAAATDEDSGDEMTFSITSGNTDDAFQIDAASGEITVKTSALLDFETTPTFMLTVQVSDDEGLSDDAEITVNLTDVAEVSAGGNSAPVIVAQSFSVAENAAAGTALGTVVASDKDNDPLTFAILSGNDAGTFAIHASNGVLSVTSSDMLNITANPVLTLSVSVSDGKASNSAIITINLTTAVTNNTAPMITAQSFSVAENAAIDAAVGTVTATDAENDPLTFSITSGNTGDVFNINVNSGAITVAKALDYETTPNYTLMVRVSDRAAFSMAAVTINITNVNEAPEISNQTFSIAENAALDAAVGTIAASDADGDNLTFSITSGNTNDAFQIDAASGEITVKTAAPLDYEIVANRTFILMVEVSDGTTPAEAAVTINVTNVNDNAPKISNETFSVVENAAVDAAVGTVTASDADGDNLTFSITSGNTDDAFQIDAASGEVTVKTTAPLDYEIAANRTFTLMVQVSDGTTSADAAVTINVTNVNDNAPEISNQTFSITENLKEKPEGDMTVGTVVGTTVGTVMASDADGDNLTFSITSGNAIGNSGDVFQIDAGSGEITVKTAEPLDYEIEANRTFNLMVQVSDGDKTADAVVTINVTNENDNAPTFVLAQSFTVGLDAKVGTLVGTLMATDADGDKLSFISPEGNLVNRNLSVNGILVDGDTGKITTTDDLTKFYSSGFDTAILFEVTDGKFTTPGGKVTINFQ